MQGATVLWGLHSHSSNCPGSSHQGIGLLVCNLALLVMTPDLNWEGPYGGCADFRGARRVQAIRVENPEVSGSPLFGMRHVISSACCSSDPDSHQGIDFNCRTGSPHLLGDSGQYKTKLGVFSKKTSIARLLRRPRPP